MLRIARFRLAALAAAVIAQPAWAEPGAGTFTFQIENDRIADTDRHYTHGTRLAWVSDKASDGPQWAKDALEWLYPLADLRAGRSVHAETTRQRNGLTIDTLDSVELDLGIVGPESFAEDVQDGYHDLIGVARSNGWDHQLKNEPGVALIFERKWRPAPWRFDGLEFDLIPSAGGSLGNVMTQLNLGAMVRLGQSLDVDYGPSHPRPTLSDVDKKPLVGDFQIGAAVVWRGVRLAFTHVFRTKEFDGQRRADRYGALSLSVHF